MVLGRGRGYDDIAKMLSIDRAGVRDRALEALDALGPSTSVSSQRRHLIVDYLLGQLPPRVADETRNRLAASPSERAWARVVASELAPLASGPMPEIPTEAPPEPEPEPEPAQEPEPERERDRAPVAADVPAAAAPEAEAERIPADYGLREPAGPRGPRVSRLGGAILLALVAAVVIAVVVVVVVSSGSSNKHHAPVASRTSTSAASTTSASTTATPVAQINLVSPAGTKSTAGIAEVL